jgi:replicative DNA helicase
MLAVVENPMIANVEEEAALLGAMMQERSLIDAIADRVTSEHFHEPLHGRIFDAILSLHSQGRTASPVTLKPLFADDPAMIDVGGPTYLITIMGTTGAEVIGAKDFADDIRELALRRKLIAGLREAIKAANDPAMLSAEIVSLTEEAVAASTSDDGGTRQFTASECIALVVDGLSSNEHGITSGIGSLDATLGPICRRNLVIMGGRPGMGKSAVASSYALGAASRGHGTLFVSLEMSAEELGERMASDLCFDSTCQVPYSAITAARVQGDQGMSLVRAGDHIRDLPLSIIDIGSASLFKLNGLVRRHKRRMAAKGERLELVIVDYLQLVSPDQREQTPYAAVSAVSRGLKALAKTHDVAVMALTQLSRKVEERADRRPRMADLRDSGQIEQDADAIVFLYAEEYYLLQCEDTPEREAALAQEAGKIEFIVAKRRRGPGGIGHGRYYRQFQAVRG